MTTDIYPGRRLSYGGATCTVHYTGPVSNTKGAWLGVEWDDSSRGKHDGSHDGVRYFDCQSSSSTAGSFVRPTRPIDEPVSFLDGFRKKYASVEDEASTPEVAIQIGGKTVEEVGFGRISAQLATLHELRIVLLDRLCIRGVLDRPYSSEQELWLQEYQRIKDQELKIQELDLSRTLIEEWADVVGICGALKYLKILRLDGNRFRDSSLPERGRWEEAFSKVRELSLAGTFLSWNETTSLVAYFPALTTLSLASNDLLPPPRPLPILPLRDLNLTSNSLKTLSSLSPLTNLSNLRSLNLRSNPITSLTSPTPFPFLSTLDLTSTALTSPEALNPLLQAAPKLSSLITSHTPLHATPASHLQTIARLPTLISLNHSKISSQERSNAELYYLSIIASSLSSTPASHEPTILREHPRYHELCALHGAPTINRKSGELNAATNEPRPGTVAARLVTFALYLPSTSEDATPQRDITITVPRTTGIYALKGIVGRLLALKPMKLKLIWETGEWDPVAGTDDSDESSESSESEDVDGDRARHMQVGRQGRDVKDQKEGKWVQREEELVDGTKDVGFWIEGKEARVRIELR